MSNMNLCKNISIIIVFCMLLQCFQVQSQVDLEVTKITQFQSVNNNLMMQLETKEQEYVTKLTSEYNESTYYEYNDPNRDFMSKYLRLGFETLSRTLDNYPMNNNPTSRFRDLSMVNYILSLVDLAFTSNQISYLNLATQELSKLQLLVNGTFIEGIDSGGGNFTLLAEDNLLLILMYERLALAAERFSLSSEVLWNEANIRMTSFYDLFYHVDSGLLNHSLILDKNNNYVVIGGLNYTSGAVVGLYTMAAYQLNSTEYMDIAEAILNNYDGNSKFFDGDMRPAWFQTVGSTTNTDTYIDLKGNILLATAFLQLSSHKKNTDPSSPLNGTYFETAEEHIEEGILSYFINPTTGLYHSYYNTNTTETVKTSPEAFILENSMLISLIAEYRRKFVEFNGFHSPLDLRPLMDKMLDSLYNDQTFRGGITSSGVIIPYRWDRVNQNPLILNFQAVTALLKISPIVTKLYIPNIINIRINTYFYWNISFSESTSIYGSSNASSFRDCQTFLNFETEIEYEPFMLITTTNIDGIKKRDDYQQSMVFNLNEGGDKVLSLELVSNGIQIISTSIWFIAQKDIGITTDPTDITATIGVDSNVRFTANCFDEKGAPIAGAQLTVYINEEFFDFYGTLESGKVDISIPIEFLQPVEDPEALSVQESNNSTSTITISAIKPNHRNSSLVKNVNIFQNALILKFSNELLVKRGEDLTVTVSVQPEIPTAIINPIANIHLNGEKVTFNNEFDIRLPQQINFETHKAKENLALDVIVRTGNFIPIVFNNTIFIQELSSIESIISFFNNILSETWFQVIGSLGVVWAILWKQMRIKVLKTLRKCHYCGESTARKYPNCSNCGEILDEEKYQNLKGKVEEESEE